MSKSWDINFSMIGPFGTMFDLERYCLSCGCKSAEIKTPEPGRMIVNAVMHGRIDHARVHAGMLENLSNLTPVGVLLQLELFNELHEKEIVLPGLERRINRIRKELDKC